MSAFGRGQRPQLIEEMQRLREELQEAEVAVRCKLGCRTRVVTALLRACSSAELLSWLLRRFLSNELMFVSP